MDLDRLRNELTADGWGDVGPGQHVGIDFDLIGSRRFTLTRWSILVKTLPVLDAQAAMQWQATFQTISEASKSLVWGKCFLLCLIAEEISSEVVQTMSGDRFGALGAFRLKGGGGNILIADARTGQVYGRVPRIPYDVRKFSQSAMNILRRTLVGTPGSKASVQATATCPDCGKSVREGAKFCDDCGASLVLTCTECGASLRVGVKFCDECGAPVAEPSASGEA